MTHHATDLFTPLRVGPYALRNRVFMAPMTRCRAGAGHLPTAMMAEYYGQRATAGLIISEATQISESGKGYPSTPGIHTPEQTAGWRVVTEAVHAKGGRIFAQLWHVGRVSHPAYQPGGALPVSSSPTPRTAEVFLPDGTSAPAPKPRALTVEEIRGVMKDYRDAAECALRAGFDGVELHGANGYLPDQFLRDGVNQRTDEYGGSIQNRARFHLEATRALAEVWGPERVGVRLSPCGTFNDMRDSNPRATFGYVVSELGKMGLGYLHIMEAMEGDYRHGKSDATWEAIPVSYFRPMFKGVLVTNAGFTFEKATAYLKEGWADAVAFGVPFISNPDLVERFRRGAAPAPADEGTFYTPGAKGYTDYPAIAAGA